ncbi:MAG: Endopolyphosphatase [Candelina mexicana]|nr:MAG: Endopolyphosphatase [Candelina mexicana]
MRVSTTTISALAATSVWALPPLQQPLLDSGRAEVHEVGRKLHGRFLHITGTGFFHLVHSSTEKYAACHRDPGSAGLYGAETTDCDSPISLINATMKWVEENLKDNIDFIVWTGDSARHDNDPAIPRTETEVLDLNRMLVDKFVEVFGKEDNINDTDPTNDLIVPIVPTFGNNDMLPHNILKDGPNRWTKNYLKIWEKMIPEEQRHGFERGGWFFVEVIPNRLAVFSLNTMYFFGSNAAVDGCSMKSEPGYEQFEWLRIQLEFLRQRGMKAILSGHVPPARTEYKRSWDETCWQKYALWIKQYRDVVVGSMYGHMNRDHFILQDLDDIHKKLYDGISKRDITHIDSDEELSIESAADYLMDLRESWAKLPNPPAELKEWAAEDEEQDENEDYESFGSEALRWRRKKSRRDNKHREMQKYFRKIGGPWAERFGVAQVSPSVVPNYYPTLRIIEYNTTGLETISTSKSPVIKHTAYHDDLDRFENLTEAAEGETDVSIERKKRKKKHKPKKPDFIVPQPPSSASPPGPAYSPQTFTFLGYTQYFANLTYINNDIADHDSVEASKKWKGKRPKQHLPLPDSTPNNFEYEVEYSTFEDKIFQLRDLTVKSYLDLAIRIGKYKPRKGDQWNIEDDTSIATQDSDAREETEEHPSDSDGDNDDDDEPDIDISKKKHKKKKKHREHRKHKKRKAINKVWFTFVKRAFVGTVEDRELHDTFGEDIVDDESIDGVGDYGAGEL